MDWIIANWTSVATVIAYIVAIASVIARLTPTQADNAVVDVLLKILDVLGINNLGKVGIKS